MLALGSGQLTIAELLIESNADVNAAQGSHRTTALHVAASAREDRSACVRFLLAAKAVPDPSTHEAFTPLHMAVHRGRNASCNHLVAAGASVNAATRQGWSPLHYAVHVGVPELVTVLRLNGSSGKVLNVEHANSLGLRPLHMAVMARNVGMCQALVQIGASTGAAPPVSPGLNPRLSQGNSRGDRLHAEPSEPVHESSSGVSKPSPLQMAQENLDRADDAEAREVAKAVLAALLPAAADRPEDSTFVSAIVAGVQSLPAPRR